MATDDNDCKDQEVMQTVNNGPCTNTSTQEERRVEKDNTAPEEQMEVSMVKSEKDTTSSMDKDVPNMISSEKVEFTAIYKKQKYNITFAYDETIAELKKHIETLTSVPASMQKLMFKGLAKDDKTLRELRVTNGSKIMVVGSTLNDVLAINTITADPLKDEPSTSVEKEPLCRQKMHKKVLDKGKPDDTMPGIKDSKEPLPTFPIFGMLNKLGGKVRLTFKMELDQLWIGTKERTEKIPMNSIKAVVSEPIENHEEYHIVGIQLGPTEASRYWVYWVPAQYVDAIKDAILG